MFFEADSRIDFSFTVQEVVVHVMQMMFVIVNIIPLLEERVLPPEVIVHVPEVMF